MQSLFKIAAANGGGRGQTKITGDLVYRVYKEKSGKASGLFSIHPRMVKQMRWITGDKIDILYDSDARMGQLVRCKEGGWALSVAGGQKLSERTRHQVRCTLKPQFGLPEENSDCDCEATESTITFSFKANGKH